MPKVTQAQPAAHPDAALMDDKGVFTGKDQDGNPVVTSAEGEGTGKPTAAATGKVKVKIGDTEHEVDESSAALIEALNAQNQQLFAYLQTMQTQNANGTKPAVKSPDAAAGYDFATNLFTEPEVAIARLREEIKAEVKAEMTNAYTAAENQKEFWNAFYTANPDLKNEKVIVDAIMRRDWNKLAPMSNEKAAEAIAASVKKELLRLSGGKSKSDESNRGLEGASTRQVETKSGQKQEDVVGSLSAFIRQRQEARRKAMFHKE